MPDLLPGLVGESAEPVTPEKTAAYWGSGLVAGFSTPALVALLENAAFTAIEKILPAGQTTVGTTINIKHLAATPVGMNVRARAELVAVDGRKLTFNVEAWDDFEKIGEGSHTRFVVDMEKFTLRLHSKFDNLNK